MKTIKELHFLIDENVTRQILGDNKYTKIYTDLSDFFQEKGWKKLAKNLYISSKELEDGEINQLIVELKERYPYISKCVKDLKQTDITEMSVIHTR